MNTVTITNCKECKDCVLIWKGRQASCFQFKGGKLLANNRLLQKRERITFIPVPDWCPKRASARGVDCEAPCVCYSEQERELLKMRQAYIETRRLFVKETENHLEAVRRAEKVEAEAKRFRLALEKIQENYVEHATLPWVSVARKALRGES